MHIAAAIIEAARTFERETACKITEVTIEARAFEALVLEIPNHPGPVTSGVRGDRVDRIVTIDGVRVRSTDGAVPIEDLRGDDRETNWLPTIPVVG